jgi:transcriptional regulator with XRE-family HTH domain
LIAVNNTADPSLKSRRRGFWLRMAREGANLTQSAAAAQLGLSGKSKSTLSAWEAGTRDPSLRQLDRAAELYGVPVQLFLSPEPTAFERLDELIADAAALESEDSEAEEGEGDPKAEGELVALRRRRSA